MLVQENYDLDYFLRENGISNRQAGKEVVYAAGLLHDIGKWKEYRDGDEHASYSAKLARTILPRAFFNPDEIEIICQAIFEHSHLCNDISFLGERLYRADNLSRKCLQCEYHEQCPKARQKVTSADLPEY